MRFLKNKADKLMSSREVLDIRVHGEKVKNSHIEK